MLPSMHHHIFLGMANAMIIAIGRYYNLAIRFLCRNGTAQRRKNAKQELTDKQQNASAFRLCRRTTDINLYRSPVALHSARICLSIRGILWNSIYMQFPLRLLTLLLQFGERGWANRETNDERGRRRLTCNKNKQMRELVSFGGWRWIRWWRKSYCFAFSKSNRNHL